ncbi:MAG: hypothetical protein IJO64_02345, partial [Clostridia bacterium]|nr:hypothetical protein [Clostridia bacterium]
DLKGREKKLGGLFLRTQGCVRSGESERRERQTAKASKKSHQPNQEKFNTKKAKSLLFFFFPKNSYPKPSLPLRKLTEHNYKHLIIIFGFDIMQTEKHNAKKGELP